LTKIADEIIRIKNETYGGNKWNTFIEF
jgi:hypothetical protein